MVDRDDLSVENDLENLNIEEWYTELEKNFDIDYSHNGELSYLCDGKLNLDTSIHSWFNLKEAFSQEFPVWIVERLRAGYNFEPQSALDPFCGGGTTLVALSQLGIHTVGVEYNPFIASVAKAKSMWHAYKTEEIRSAIEGLSFDVPSDIPLEWPALTTFRNHKYFRKADVRTMLHVVRQLQESKLDKLTKQFLYVGIAAAVEDVTNLRKDGRALRYVPKANRPNAKTALLARWEWNLEALEGTVLPQPAQSVVWRGSATKLRGLEDPWECQTMASLANSSFDLILYSPPYLNNFDYSEIYKLELWLLGYIRDYEEWRNLRRGTIRSHHSIKFEETSYLEDNQITRGIFRKLKALGRSDLLTGYAELNMPPVIVGYFEDMYLSLKEQFRVLEPGGFLVFMVANSCHADLPIATDVIIGEIATLLGFEPLKLIVVQERNDRTRQKIFLRESIALLRKPL